MLVYSVKLSRDKKTAVITDRRNDVKYEYPVAAFNFHSDQYDPATFQFPMSIADKVRKLSQ